MRSIFDLITKNGTSNTIIPIIALTSIFCIILIYALVKSKWIKYAFSSGILIIGIIFFFSGYQSIIKDAGLEIISLSVKILTFGLIGLMTSVIFDIIDSLAGMFKKNKRVKKT